MTEERNKLSEPHMEHADIVIGLNTCVHRLHDGGFCEACEARHAASAKGLCLNCKVRPATQDWVGRGSAMDWVHGNYERWCDRCAAEAQLAYAREAAATIPDLERRVQELSHD